MESEEKNGEETERGGSEGTQIAAVKKKTRVFSRARCSSLSRITECETIVFMRSSLKISRFAWCLHLPNRLQRLRERPNFANGRE